MRLRKVLLLTLLWASAASAAPPVIVDATGAVVGYYVGPAPNELALVVSAMGYTTAVNFQTGVVGGTGGTPDGSSASGNPRFTSPNCTGVAYLQNTKTGGFVVRTQGGELWYSMKGTEAEPQALVSEYHGPGDCRLDSATSGIRIIPNDPAVTGFPNQPFVPPLTIGFVPTYDELLLIDGFEAAANMVGDRDWIA